MPNYGFGATAMGAGAQAGLQELLKRRLLERQMALAEQAQRENTDYRNRDLEMRSKERSDALAEASYWRQDASRQRQEGIDRMAGENLVQTKPVGGDINDTEADLLTRTGNAGVIRAIPLTGETIEGGTPTPIRFRGFTPQESQQREMQAQASADRATAREDAQAAQAEQSRLSRENTAAIAGMRRDARVTTVQEYDPDTGTIVTVGVDPETGEEQWRKGGKMTADAMGRAAAYGRASKIVDKLQEQAARIQLGQGAAARIAEPKQRAEAYANLNLDIAEYMSTLKGFAPLIARSLGHTGVLTELDVDSVRQAFWQPGESGALRDRKFSNVRAIMDSMRQSGNMEKPQAGAVPPAVVEALSQKGPGRYKLSDGTSWVKNQDGSIVGAK